MLHKEATPEEQEGEIEQRAQRSFFGPSERVLVGRRW